MRKSSVTSFISCVVAMVCAAAVAATPSGPFAPGSVWMNDMGTLKLIVHEQEGETFRATFDAGKSVRRVTGTIQGKLVFWLAKDVTAKAGKSGHDNFGTLVGDSIHFVYRTPGSSKDEGSFVLKRVNAPAPAPAVAGAPPAPRKALLSAIQTDASQPRIQVIKEQGPNAAEWALTPLDEGIPGDIRQNITYLREDLLDEGKKSPKAAAAAYALATDYCDKLLSALSQREIARVNAGYSAAQADANKATSTQALEARRNHMMSWPQYAREESQRAALRENETDKADVKKARLKVEWVSRGEQMRAHLDAAYRQLREAMR